MSVFSGAPGGGTGMAQCRMTLRDYFAAKAMQGQLAFSPHDSFDKTNTPDEVAKLAYRFADAMLAERDKP